MQSEAIFVAGKLVSLNELYSSCFLKGAFNFYLGRIMLFYLVKPLTRINAQARNKNNTFQEGTIPLAKMDQSYHNPKKLHI